MPGEIVVENTRVIVEIGFATNAGSNRIPWNGSFNDIIWTDVSQYVRSVSTQRGRSKELDAFTTGSATVVFDNRSRTFDPDYTAGPYYGSLTPMRPIRIKAVYFAGSQAEPIYSSGLPYDIEGAYDDFPLFSGFVDGWPQEYEPPKNASVSVNCSDAFKLLSQYELDEYWKNQVLRDSPMLWYRMDDGTGSAILRDSMSKYVPDVRTRTGYTAPQTVTDGLWWVQGPPPAYTTEEEAPSLIVNSENKSAKFNGDKKVLWIEPSPITIDDTDITVDAGTIEMVFSWDAVAPGTNINHGLICLGSGQNGTLMWAFLTRSDGFGITVLNVGVAPSGPRSFIPVAATVNVYRIIVGNARDAGGPAHLVMTTGDNWGVWLNGTKISTSAYFVASYGGLFGFTYNGQIGIAATTGSGTYLAGNTFLGTIDEVVLYRNQNALSDSRIAAHVAGVKAAPNETTGARITRLLDHVGWPADARKISAGTAQVVSYNPTGSALSYAQAVEQAESGKLFVDGSGDVTFRSRTEAYTNPILNTAQKTYGDGSGEFGYSAYGHAFDDQLIRNKVTMAREGGTEYLVVDDESISSYWERPYSETGLLNNSDSVVQNMATYELNTYKQALPRITGIQVTPMGQEYPPTSGVWSSVLGFDIGTRVKVRRRPQGVGSAIEYQTIIEGISHEISPKSWFTTYELSPAAATDSLILNNVDIAALDSPTAKLGF
jgi:hypothetical protein